MGSKRILAIAGVSLVILLLLALPLLSACKAEEPAVKTLKIGTGQARSGPISMVGLIYVHGFEMAVDRINEQGGLKIGGDTYMIELLVEDNQGNPDMSANAATKLIFQEGVKFLIGDVGDMDTPGFYGIVREAGDVMFIHSWLNISAMAREEFGVPSEDVGPDKPLMIRLHPAVDEGMYKGFEYLANNYPDVKSVGVCGLDFVFFDAFGLYHELLLPQYGLEMAGDFERFPQDCADFYPVLTRMLESNPDALSLGYCGLDQYILQLKAARDMGFTGPIVHVPPFDETFVAMLSSPNLTDVFGNGIATDDPKLPDSLKEVIELGKAKYGDEFISDSIDAYDTMMLLAQAIEKAQSTDPQTVQDVFETLTEPGSLQSIYGPAYVGGLETTGVNRVIVRPVPFSRVVNGHSEFVGCFTTDIP
jgi:branched-chain amino acid transport system substrate-binding protein